MDSCGLSRALAVEGVDMDEESDERAEGSAVGATEGDFGAGCLIESEQKDDVGGDAEAEDGVINGGSGEAPEGEEGGQEDQSPGREIEVGCDESGEGWSEDK